MTEKMQILNMLEKGKISVDEAHSLLEALDKSPTSREKTDQPLFLKVKVKTDDEDDKTNINVKIPVSFINLGLKFADRFSPEFKKAGLSDKDIDFIMQSIEDGHVGKIVDIDEGNGNKVEILIE